MRRRDLTAETAEDKFNVQAEAEARGIKAYQVRASRAVNSQLVADIVNDFRRGPSQPSSMAVRPGDPEPKPSNNGWQDPVPLSTPPGIEIIDALVEAQTHRQRLIAAQQEAELREIERRINLSKAPLVQSEFNPYSRERMGFSDDE